MQWGSTDWLFLVFYFKIMLSKINKVRGSFCFTTSLSLFNYSYHNHGLFYKNKHKGFLLCKI